MLVKLAQKQLNSLWHLREPPLQELGISKHLKSNAMQIMRKFVTEYWDYSVRHISENSYYIRK